MGFPEQTTRAFTQADVKVITEGQMGCYGLFKKDQ